jgi:hypothetical protein
MLKKEKNMKLVDWIVRIHGGIRKIGTVIVVEA